MRGNAGMPSFKDSAAIARKAGHTVKDFAIGGKVFCCCVPVRLGVVIGSFLSFIVSGTLSVIVWFEVSTEHDITFSASDRSAFILAGVLESLLFVTSVLGFVGAIVRKYLLISIFCYFLYLHFFITLGVASYILWMINHAARSDIVLACQTAIRNPQAQKQCTGLLNITRGTFIGVAILILGFELWGTFIVTRYMRHLRNEHKERRASRTRARDRQLFASSHNRYLSIHDDDLDDLSDGKPLIHNKEQFDETHELLLSNNHISDSRLSSYTIHEQATPVATHFPLTPHDFPKKSEAETEV